MKLRIKGNSIRIRLSRPEVEQLAKEQYLEEKTGFADNVFVYALQGKDELSDLSAAFSNGKMTMYVPTHIAAKWADNEVVGYNYNMELGNGQQLYLLLEKDFKCIDSDEDQADNYDNPNQEC